MILDVSTPSESWWWCWWWKWRWRCCCCCCYDDDDDDDDDDGRCRRLVIFALCCIKFLKYTNSIITWKAITSPSYQRQHKKEYILQALLAWRVHTLESGYSWPILALRHLTVGCTAPSCHPPRRQVASVFCSHCDSQESDSRDSSFSATFTIPTSLPLVT